MTLINETIDGFTYPALTEFDEPGLRELVAEGPGARGIDPSFHEIQKTALKHFDAGLVVAVDLAEEGMGSNYFWMTKAQKSVWDSMEAES